MEIAPKRVVFGVRRCNMTSIIVFKANKGDQLIIVGDTQHTYSSSTIKGKKIFKLNDKIIFCGAGYDEVIDTFRNRLLLKDCLKDCVDHITNSDAGQLNGKYHLQDVSNKISPEQLINTSFILIDSSELKTEIIERNEPRVFDKIAIIGSGKEFQGWIEERINSLFEEEFNDEKKNYFFNIILSCFCDIGKNDPSTGHPSVFDLTGYVLEKEENPISFKISFKPNTNNIDNYKIVEGKDD